MIRFISIYSILCCLCLSASGQGVVFSEHNWQNVVNQAQEQQKMIFVDLVTDWCSPCKKMSREVFPNESVGTFYNANFINLKLDAENDSLGIWMKDSFNVTGFPTLLYFGPDGTPLHRWAGSRNVKQLIELGEAAKDPNTQFYTIKQNWEDSNNDPDWLLEYMIVSSDAGVSIRESINEYESLTSPEDWMKKKNWKRLSQLDLPFTSEVYSHSSKHRKEYGLADDSPFHNQVQFFYLMRSSFAKTADTASIKSAIRHAHDGIHEKRALAEFEMQWTRRNKPDSAWQETVTYLDEYCYIDYFWGQVATEISQDDDATHEELTKAMEWIDRALDLNNIYNHLSTKAWLCYRLGDEHQARTLAHEAIELANVELIDHTLMNKLLGLMGE